MGWLRQLRAGWRVLVRREVEDQRTQTELEHYREELTQSLVARGMSFEEARRAAGAEMGSMLAAREEVRDGGWEAWMSGWMDDVRYTARRLRRSPGFTFAAVLTLGLGLGGVAAIFTVLDGVLLKGLPYANAERLIALTHTAPGIQLPVLNMSNSLYFTYREEGKSFEDLALWNGNWMTVSGRGAPTQVPTLFATYSFLDVLGVRPAIGRGFEARDGEVNGARAVILSDGYWRKEYGGAPDVLGKTILLDGASHEIIGVLPRRFEFLDERVSILVPMRPDRGRTRLVGFGERGIARLRPGVSMEKANADAARCLQMAPQKFAVNPGMPANILQIARVAPVFESLRDHQLGTVRETLWVLAGAVLLLLGLACANVSNLLLVRTESRQKEISVRRALGAGWARTARDIVVETVLLSLAGSVCAMGFGWLAIEALRRAEIANLPRIENIAMDLRSVAATVAVAIVVGVIVGLVTVWAALRRTSWEGMRPSSRKQQGLLALQMALAMVLLVACGLVMRSFVELQRVEPGLRQMEQVQVVRISLASGAGEKLLRMHQAIAAGFAGMPGVEAVAVTTNIPMEGGAANPQQAEGHPANAGASAKVRDLKRVSPGYLRSVGTRLMAGRDFEWRDLEAMAPVVMVSENMARELWGEARLALGKRIRENSAGEWKEIVGVVEDVRQNGPMREAPSIVYTMLAQRDPVGKEMGVPRNVDYLIRSPRAGSALFVEELRQTLMKVEPSVPLAKVRTLEEVYRKSMARTALTLALMGAAGAMALVLGVVGVYGVVAYAVARRRKDIGIRLALGATGASVSGLFLRDGLRTALVGAGIGLLAALAMSRLMKALLFGVGASDPITYASVAVLLVSAAALASWWPARRAAAVNPIEALRTD